MNKLKKTTTLNQSTLNHKFQIVGLKATEDSRIINFTPYKVTPVVVLEKKKKALFPFQKVLGSECVAVWEQLRHYTEALWSSDSALESQKPDEFPGSQYGQLLSSS